MTLEEAIKHAEATAIENEKEAKRKREHGGRYYDSEARACAICAEENRQLADWLRELQERRKADNEIPFGDSYSFTELDSIINAYEVHGGYYKEVVELLKELRERRKQPEIIRCKDCAHYHTDVFGGELGVTGIWENLIVAHNACDKWAEGMNCVTPDGFCFLAERRTGETD